MKVLSLSSVFPNPSEPGCGTFVRSRLRHLSALVELKVLAPVPVVNYSRWTGAPKQFVSRRQDGPLDVRHVRWAYLPGGGFLNAVFLFLQLLGPVVRLRREFRFDLIDAHFGHPEGITAALLAAALGCPFTVTLRGSEVVHAKRPFRRLWMAWALRRADRVIAVSEPLRSFAIGLGVDAGRVRTIPNGVDAGVFFPRDRMECRRKHGIAPGVRMILSAGHLTELKGHHRVMSAVTELVKTGEDVQLWIAGGSGRYSGVETELRAQASSPALSGRVRLLGEVPPEVVAELMSAADVFCLASEREGWPNVVQEALSCGTPVVATRVGGAPEMIPSARYGSIVPPGDSGALQDALRSALATGWDRAEIASWGGSRSWEQVAREVFQEMTGATAAPALEISNATSVSHHA